MKDIDEGKLSRVQNNFAERRGLLGSTLILDLADEQGSFCSKLLADLGATVVKVEGSAGDPLRSGNPNAFFYCNTNKLGICLDRKTPEGMRVFRALVKRADVLVETCPSGTPLSNDLGRQRFRRLNARLIHISITPFGRTASLKTRASEAPLELSGCHPYYISSLFGAAAILIRLRKRKITGDGSYLDLSTHEAVASMLEHQLGVRDRPGPRHAAEDFSILRAQDGFVQIPILRNWETVAELLATDEEAGSLVDKNWQDPAFREQHFSRILTAVEAWTRRHTRREILELGQAMRFPWASVDTIDETLENPQLKSRQFFFQAEPFDGAPSSLFPGVPFKFSGVPNCRPGPAPLLGEHTRIVLEEFGAGQKRKEGYSAAKLCCADEKILEGTRVMDLTHMISGSYATRIFADFGAEVIKIQSERTAHGAEQNDTYFFSIWNRNKRSINLDLNLPEARNVFLKLVKNSDVVVENFSPRVMANWGLEYTRLREVNPGLVMVSISAMGQTGPWKDFVGFAPTFHALSGLISATSVGSDPPSDIGYPYADMVAGLYAALAALAALEYKDRTGKGQHIDLSALEAICTFDSRFSHKGRSGLFDWRNDLQLTARRFLVRLHHPLLGKVLSVRTPLWDWRRKPRWKSSPLFGE